MAAENQNLVTPQGDTLRFSFVPTDADGDIILPGAGATIRWWMGRSRNSSGGDVWIKRQVGQANSLWTAEKVTIELLPAETVILRQGSWYHEASVTFATGEVKRLFTGIFQVVPTIIRS